MQQKHVAQAESALEGAGIKKPAKEPMAEAPAGTTERSEWQRAVSGKSADKDAGLAARWRRTCSDQSTDEGGAPRPIRWRRLQSDTSGVSKCSRFARGISTRTPEALMLNQDFQASDAELGLTLSPKGKMFSQDTFMMSVDEAVEVDAASSAVEPKQSVVSAGQTAKKNPQSFDTVCSNTKAEEDKLDEAVVGIHSLPEALELSEERGPFDGHWVLNQRDDGLQTWLGCLAIRGTSVIDGDGMRCQIFCGDEGPQLFGGALFLRNDALVRRGKSGREQVFVR